MASNGELREGSFTSSRSPGNMSVALPGRKSLHVVYSLDQTMAAAPSSCASAAFSQSGCSRTGCVHISHCRAHAIIGSMRLLEDALGIVHARYCPPEATVTHFDEFTAGGRILRKEFKSGTGKNFALGPIR